MLSSIGTKTNTLEHNIVSNWLSFAFWALLCWQSTYCSTHTSHNFPGSWKDALGNGNKRFTKVKVNDIHFHPLVHWTSHLITFTSFMCPEMTFRKICFMIFPGHWLVCVFPDPSSLNWQCLPKQSHAMPAWLYGTSEMPVASVLSLPQEINHSPVLFLVGRHRR